MYVLKVEYSTSNIVRIYFSFIIVKLINISFSVSIMTAYTVAVSDTLTSFGSYKVCYLLIMTVTSHSQQYTYITNIIKTPIVVCHRQVSDTPSCLSPSSF